MDKKLYRKTSDKMIAGVCSGLADYLNVDASVIRIAWILLVLFAGTGALAYIIAMLVIPPQDTITKQ